VSICIKTTVASLAALVLSSINVSAAVVCNEEGDCWRVKERIEYKPELRLRVYEDDWKWKDGEKYRWRDAGPGRGYWRGGVWVGID
jgi:hypothetical protein